MALVDDDCAKAEDAEHDGQPQPVPEVREKELTQILCNLHINLLLRFIHLVPYDKKTT